jgi:asparagine synthase (glutamine-hydrolysing)
MGVIYGYISLTNKPVDPAIAETMRNANSFWNPDGDELFICEHAALGSLILFNTPEAIFEKQPIHFEDNRKVMVATGRIDNRDDLCRVFNIPLSARDIYPDSFYIRLAYEKWGEACPDHLIGDWSFAVYDKLARKLFIARDHHGIMACYYYQGPDFFVFSSSLKGILCLPQVEKKVNEYKIAQILVSWNEGGPQTCYQNIFRLPPAHTLTLENTKFTTNRYWYLEHTPEIHLKNDQEYIDMFRDIYTEAVRCRLRSYRPVGATLSGGLDSGSVCILAAQQLAKYGKRLPAFTAVPMYDVPWPKNRIGDEGPLAIALAEKLGNVDVTLCKAENISPVKGVEIMMDVHDQPEFVANNAYWMIDLFNRALLMGMGTLLIGQSGNLTVSWPMGSLLNKKVEKEFFTKQVRIIKKLIKKVIYINQIKSNFENNFYKKNGVNVLLIKQLESNSKVKKSNIFRLDKIKAGKNIAGNLHFENGLFFKLELRDPTIDLRLIKYLFGLPHISIYSRSRILFNSNFQDFFNNELLECKIKGVQSNDLTERIESEEKKILNQMQYNSISNIIAYDYFEKLKNTTTKNSIINLMGIYKVNIFFNLMNRLQDK